ncbi:hypothetical protein BDM02DRAFT_3129832 [Thelephora ganbajun]|uniref:Uncharacterized protein n=1 Tax=Thelephora ganbajun TaxID=370292 RepID=A0ACB6ZCZ5_THEGA|nr:hypothetical protein BDM02DRAFT_3129832 [Thelephora ganbajun]
MFHWLQKKWAKGLVAQKPKNFQTVRPSMLAQQSEDRRGKAQVPRQESQMVQHIENRRSSRTFQNILFILLPYTEDLLRRCSVFITTEVLIVIADPQDMALEATAIACGRELITFQRPPCWSSVFERLGTRHRQPRRHNREDTLLTLNRATTAAFVEFPSWSPLELEQMQASVACDPGRFRNPNKHNPLRTPPPTLGCSIYSSVGICTVKDPASTPKIAQTVRILDPGSAPTFPPRNVTSRHADPNKVHRHNLVIPLNRADVQSVRKSWLKDLVTLHNPRSPITFLNYLHSQGRPVSSINNGSPIPSRKEFADRLAWPTGYVQLNGVYVFYGEQAIVIPKGPDGTLILFPAADILFNLRTKATRDMVLREFKATNYGVVNSRTIDNPYEPLRERQIDDSTAKRAEPNNDQEEIHQQSAPPPRITTRDHPPLAAADLIQTSTSGNNGDDAFLLTSQSSPTNGPVHVLPDHAQESGSEASLPSDFDVEVSGMTDSSTSTSSSVNTPPTSPGSSSPILGDHPGCRDVNRDLPSKVYVTRTYQLVPKDADTEPVPRAHIQGCTESAHGLGDTLLSVMSVKAGEIAGDLMRA